MADTKKQGAMVLHEEGMTAPTLAPPPTSAPSLFVVLKQVHPGDAGKDKGSLLAISEANNIVKSSISSAATGIHPTSSTSLADTDTTTHPENLPPDARCKGITVTLDNNSMWNEFSKCQTEMILNKQGRRMFPYCRFRLSGMEPFQSYLLAMDIIPVDTHRYKWSGKGWEPNGKADPHISRLFVHPESPATGLHWMQYPVSFYRLKLCNNTLDQEGHIILHSMHRYIPRLHVIPGKKATEDIQIDRPDVITLSFSQTEFFAVTAYQNLRITQLKIDYNPFAKGFREDAVNARSSKAKNGMSTEENENQLRISRETTTLNNLKTLFLKRSIAAKVKPDQNVPSQTNKEKKVVNGEAPNVDRDVTSVCTKKRPLPGAFSDFLKGAHVKVKRLSLENIQKNGVVLQTAPACTDGKQEVMEISKPENVIQIEETVISDIHRHKHTDTSSKTDFFQTDENKMVIDKHKDDNITLLSGEQKEPNSDEKGDETISSLDTEAKPEAKTKKTLPHKRPEPVPLPLLALFLKQRKSKTKATTPKPEAPSSSMDSTPVLTPESSSDVMSSIASATTHLDSQSLFTSLSQTGTSTAVANNMTSLSTTSLPSSSSTVAPMILAERFSPSPSASDAFLASNTTSPAKPSYGPATDSISDVFDNADTVSVLGLDNTLRSQSDISSGFTCSVLHDTHLPTASEVNTDVSIALDTPTVTTSYSVFDVPSSKNIEVIPNQELSPRPQVVESEFVSDCLLESSKGLCPELFPQEVSPHTLSIHDDSLSLPLDDPSSPAFSLPSPAPSSPDPFPPDLFCDRPVPPRKTLDSFPERLLDCTGISSEPFTLGLFCERPERPTKLLESFSGGLVDGPIASRDSLSPSLQNRSGLPRESIDLFSQSPHSVTVNDMPSAFNSKSSETIASDYIVPEPTKPSSHGSTLKKSSKKQKKIGKLKHNEDDVFEGPVPAPMQPSLEDVEGQLFVSFMSKTALEIHLGDDVKIEAAQKTLENSDCENSRIVKEKIEMLEKDLLNDLKVMKHRQVIHPVLQEVGLKLNLLDLTLAIDLQYLGVQLPIPPPVLLPEGSSASSQVQFVSRTGKTTDFTKIKGWRDKFSGSSSLSEGVSSIDTGQPNLSAFCSDMLDEYLASEGKLIDERAANLSQTDTTSVAYQLPTKSTSYVRTLDSVLKKQVPPSISSTSIHLSPKPNNVKPTFKSKVNKKSKKYLKSGKGKQGLSTTKPVRSVDKFALSLKKPQQSKRSKIRKESKSLSAEKLIIEAPAVVSSDKTLRVEVPVSAAVSCTGGRSPGLPKTLVKLMDVEDGAVWEGKHRTYITEERAAIALATLVTVEGASKGNPDALRIIKRRAPPCLNVFCRLGCVCASLVHLRRHHHCGKPECMLGCSCLRRKVVALKTLKEEESTTEDPESQGLSEENKAKWKKNKKKKTYVLTNPEAAPEPAKRVNTLWNQRREDSDLEGLFSPPLPRALSPALLSQELQHDLEAFFSPSKQKRVGERNLEMIKDNMESNQTCARVRPFCWSSQDKLKTPVDNHHISQVSTQDIEEGELVPLNLSGPTKRLEIVSECGWSSTDSRNYVMRIVCEHMAQDRLKNPFWVGKYHIQPISKTLQETEDGSVHTYKVNISQPVQKKNDNEMVTQSEAESKQPVEKIEVKGLPFLSRCSPAGLLKAEKKAPNAPGQIMVNGKPYPQAKLELGKMGALHPANRLAAYITGRICQSGSNMVTAATTSKNSTAVPVKSVKTVNTSTSVSTPTSFIQTAVTKPPAGQVFTQFVVNHINTQNLPSTSTPHLQPPSTKIVIPSSLLMVGREAGAPGVALSPVKAGLGTQVSEPSNSTGSISSPTVSKVQAPTITILTKSPSLPLGGSTVTPTPISSSGSPISGKKTVLITVVSRNTGSTGSGPQIQKSVTQIRPSQTSGQKMMLQVVKTADGNTLYRNPNGQLVQLVPLSQIKSMNPNILSQGPTTVFRLPKPNAVTLSKAQSGSTTTVTSSSPTSQTQAKTTVTVPVSTSLSMNGKPVTLTASKSVSFSSLPSTLKVSPSFLGKSGTCTLRILPPNSVKDNEAATPTSSSSLSQGGFTLLKPTNLTPQDQDSAKSETTVSVITDTTEGPVSPVQMLLDLSKQSKMVSAEQKSCDDSKVSESLAESASQSSATTSSKPTKFSEDGSGPVYREPGELEDLVSAANPSVKDREFDTDQEERGIDSELTDDSDLYSEDDTHSDSEKEDRIEDEDSLDSEMKDYAEMVVDIETIEESAEKRNIAQLRASARRQHRLQSLQKHIEDVRKIRRVVQERVRRTTLRESFIQLQATVKSSENIKSSKMSILILAQKEINSLVQQERKLVKIRDRLRLQRERYLQTLSKLSDKSEESITLKLNEIIAKQKALEAQNKAGDLKSQQTTSKPNSKPKLVDPSCTSKDLALQSEVNDVPKLTQSPSKPIDLSLRKRRRMETSESVIDVDSKPISKPIVLDSSRNTPTTEDEERGKLTQPTGNSTHLKKSVPVSSFNTKKYAPVPRERTRPNILSRSQTVPVSPVKEPLATNVCIPQVIPLVNAMVPCNQIITINNPLQPIGITSLGPQQSTTPGVGSVSLSVPAMSRPLGVENSLPILQPQFFKITNSPVQINTNVDSVNLPNITNVISLVPPVNNLVVPQQVEKQDTTSVVQGQPTSIPAPAENQQSPSDVKIPHLEERESAKDQSKQHVARDEVNASIMSSKQDELDKKGEEDSNDPEDENLMSLLDELVLLSQQLSNDPPEPLNEDQQDMAEEGSRSDNQADTEGEDERALSPLFLTLDEDLMSPDCSKDEIDDIPPKVDDLVKVIFGSESPSISESAVAASTDAQSPAAPACSDAPTPPPLLHMKAACGGAASVPSANEGSNVAWRPMPKLVPLGLKVQDAVLNKVTASSVLKPDSQVEGVPKPYT